MEIDNIHIGEQDFDIFLNLQKKDKIAFVFDTVSYGIDAAMSKLQIFTEEDMNFENKELTKKEQSVSESFQDTIYEELMHDKHRMNILIINNSIHINSSSLSWIRKTILKLFMDGHLIVKNKLAKKLPGIDKYRYYRCYDIIGTVPPFCLS
tara:strand:+ start:184 stop:636 length:453 start_codon:yes stop_codon:yes gene_type:complete